MSDTTSRDAILLITHSGDFFTPEAVQAFFQ